jgi:hypothetical protein
MNAAEGCGPLQQVELETRVTAETDAVQTVLSVCFEARPATDSSANPPESQRSELGLAIAQSIVQEAGATMQFTTENRQRQRILISFPAVRLPQTELPHGATFRQSGEPD